MLKDHNSLRQSAQSMELGFFKCQQIFFLPLFAGFTTLCHGVCLLSYRASHFLVHTMDLLGYGGKYEASFHH